MKLVPMLFFVLVLAACGAPAPSPGPGSGGGGCVSGQTISCACPGGTQGVQTCGSFGTYGSCAGCPSGGGGGGGGGTCTPSCAGWNCGNDGCGGTCGSCQGNLTCRSGTCGVDPASRWSLIVTTGVISQRKGDGSTWDTLGGAPDPLVCITIAGERRCTGAVADNFTPVWNSRFPATSASELLGGVRVEIIDEDAAANDDICSAGNVLVTLADFQSGVGDFGCPFATVFFSLARQ